MKNANEIKTITEQVITDRRNAAKEQAINFCDTILNDAIEYSAKQGDRIAIVDVPGRINLDYVADYLKANGYGSEFNMGRRIRIYW